MDPVVANAKAIIEQGSKSFATAAKLFDTETREKAFMLYAWCRYCDDQIDGQDLGFGMNSPEPEEQARILQTLTAQTEAAMAGEPTEDPVFAAFQRVFQVISLCIIAQQMYLAVLLRFFLGESASQLPHQ